MDDDGGRQLPGVEHFLMGTPANDVVVRCGSEMLGKYHGPVSAPDSQHLLSCLNLTPFYRSPHFNVDTRENLLFAIM